MKFVRGLALLVVLVSLSVGTFPVLSQTAVPTVQLSTIPCEVPPEITEPVETHFATDSTAPRLLGFQDGNGIVPFGTPQPDTGLTVQWAGFSWGQGMTSGEEEVLFSGIWRLPRTGILTFDGGRGAVVTVVTGDVVLLVCGADGEIDTKENDQQSIPLAKGSSMAIQDGTSFYVFLDQSPATYWLFGNRQGEAPESVVTIDIVGTNGAPQVCGLSTCWPSPVLPTKPNEFNCDGDTCAQTGQPGGCGWIFCWSK